MNYRISKFILLLFLASGCGDQSTQTSSYCNPLGGQSCLTPWPSSVYLVSDESTETGYALDIPQEALPKNINGIQLDPNLLLGKRDGFSPAAPIIMAFPEGISGDNLVHYSNYAQSLNDESPTLLINMNTGDRVAHFAELDMSATAKPDRQALYIRPAKRLEGNTRYAVVLRKSLKNKKLGSSLTTC